MKERRASRRFSLSVPVIVRSSVDAGSRCNGKTRNISTRGVYFTYNAKLGVGAERNLTMIFPAECTGGSEVRIHAVGRIVRVEPLSTNGHQTIGVAAEIEQCEIVRNNERSK
jgi:hypothetical protein